MIHLAEVNEAGEKHNRKRGAIILNELSKVAMEEVAMADHTTAIRDNEDEERHHDRQVSRCIVDLPLASQDLDAFLKIDEGDVEANYRLSVSLTDSTQQTTYRCRKKI